MTLLFGWVGKCGAIASLKYSTALVQFKITHYINPTERKSLRLCRVGTEYVLSAHDLPSCAVGYRKLEQR